MEVIIAKGEPNEIVALVRGVQERPLTDKPLEVHVVPACGYGTMQTGLSAEGIGNVTEGIGNVTKGIGNITKGIGNIAMCISPMTS